MRAESSADRAPSSAKMPANLGKAMAITYTEIMKNLRNNGSNRFFSFGIPFLVVIFVLLVAWPARAEFDFEWSDYFELLGSDGTRNDVPIEIEVNEDPQPGEEVTIECRWKGGMGTIEKKSELEKALKGHVPYKAALATLKSLLPGFLIDGKNLNDIFKKNFRMAKPNFPKKEFA